MKFRCKNPTAFNTAGLLGAKIPVGAAGSENEMYILMVFDSGGEFKLKYESHKVRDADYAKLMRIWDWKEGTDIPEPSKDKPGGDKK